MGGNPLSICWRCYSQPCVGNLSPTVRFLREHMHSRSHSHLWSSFSREDSTMRVCVRVCASVPAVVCLCVCVHMHLSVCLSK